MRLVTSRREKGVPKTIEESLTFVGDTREWQEGFNEQLFTIDMAQRFLALSTADRAGKLRLEEARLQNTLGRALYAGLIANPERFKRAFKDALLAFMGDEQLTVGDEPMTRYATEAFDGVEATRQVIRRLEQDFAATRSSTDQRQLIATNDRLDAGDKIDLVDIRYRAAEAGPAIDVIRLVQVKRSVQPPAEIEKIVRAHERFVRDVLVSENVYRRVNRSMEARRTAELVRTTPGLSALSKAMEGASRTMAAWAEGDVDDARIEQSLGRTGISLAYFKSWFAQPKAGDALSEVLRLGAGLPAARADWMAGRLVRWAAEHPASSAELAALAPIVPSPDVIGAARMESVVVHGPRTESFPLVFPAGERKALTAA